MSNVTPSPSSSTLPAGSRRSVYQPGTTALRMALFFLLLLAFAFRIFLLDKQSIWWDEGISLHLATSNLAGIVSDRLDNIHPPLYFILLKVWLALSGVTVFSARYLSALAGWLLVPAAYAISTRWFDRCTGIVAAFLAAISAVSVIYAQEIRVYSLLPLAYLALLALTRELIRSDSPASGKEFIYWVVLGVVSWIALHLHYVSLFAGVYVTSWAGLSFIRGRRWPELWRLLLVQFLVFLASLPWFIAAISNWRAISGEANSGTFVTEAVPFPFLLAQVWTFHLTGLAGALSKPGIELAAAVTGLLLLLLLLLRLVDRRTRRPTAVLLANWLIPLSSALLVWLVRSFSHPRYVAMYAPGLILLAAYLILPNTPRAKSALRSVTTRATALLLLVMLTAFSLWGLALYYFDDDVAKDDIRGVAQFLEETAGAEDLILVPDTDWSLPFEYQGSTQVAMPGLESGGDYWQNLSRLTAGSPHVFLLDYKQGTRDWQNVLPFALNSSGSLSEVVEFGDLMLQIYDLDQPVSEPQFEPISAQFGPLGLSGAWVEQGAAAGDNLAVAFQWQVDGDAALPPLSVALRLLDEDGSVLAAADDRLLDRAGRPSDQWRLTDTLSTYHLLPLPPALPPLEYSLAVEVYEEDQDQIRPIDLLDQQGAPEGQTYFIPGVRTTRARPSSTREASALPDSLLAEPVIFDPGLSLEGVAFSAQELTPGGILHVQLLWQAKTKLPDLQPRLALVQNGEELAVNDSAPSGGRYPTSMWEVGEEVLETRRLVVPPGSSGTMEVVLELGDQTVLLGDISVEAQEHVFSPPEMDQDLDVQFGDVVRLAGYSLEERVYSTAETIPLTLLWESSRDGGEGDYVIFTHVLTVDGRLIGQHDGVPAQGQRPLSGWVAGEYILDRHEITFRDLTYAGTAVIEVGLYDPQNGERVRLTDGSDRFLLPLELLIEAGG
ncbi:MAG: hypothetical protein ACK2T4_13995 [Candidatus Promineifilaceae bacterium]